MGNKHERLAKERLEEIATSVPPEKLTRCCCETCRSELADDFCWFDNKMRDRKRERIFADIILAILQDDVAYAKRLARTIPLSLDEDSRPIVESKDE